ncbi:MAG: tetratricopeptide repeat protein [Candidatus Goldbacteria bacterium]|nr:tetratricopeptide repeat protein [Candidatus Goldiibacteriota bacterium]
MNCPHCGADTGNAITLCPLCGKTLDRDMAFKSFVEKGDLAVETGDIDKAIINYNKALTYKEGNEQIYLKLGNLYFKKKDKNAANMYFKVLQYNFYNDYAHNMLITLYSNFGKLDDLKNWYEKNRGKYEDGFIDKYIKIIEGIKHFSTRTDVGIKETKDDFLKDMFESMKKYTVLNIVIGFIILFLIGGLFAGTFLHLNPMIVFSFMLFFLFVVLIIVFLQRIMHINKKKKEKMDFTDIIKGDKNLKNN